MKRNTQINRKETERNLTWKLKKFRIKFEKNSLSLLHISELDLLLLLLSIATTCLSCNPPDLNFLVTYFFFIFVYM